MTTSRSYQQFCALACALDIVGERWTLLIIRELLTGPRRFKDLLDGLPDISTNLLSERLKTLEQQGILRRRTLPPPAGSNVYELTLMGQALEKTVIELGKWGSQFLPETLDCAALPSLGTVALAIKTFFHPQEALGIHETYELHLDDEVLQVQVDDGQLRVEQGQALKADAVFQTSIETFLGLFSGQLKPDDATSAGLVRLEGDSGALTRFLCLTSAAVSSDQTA